MVDTPQPSLEYLPATSHAHSWPKLTSAAALLAISTAIPIALNLALRHLRWSEFAARFCYVIPNLLSNLLILASIYLLGAAMTVRSSAWFRFSVVLGWLLLPMQLANDILDGLVKPDEPFPLAAFLFVLFATVLCFCIRLMLLVFAAGAFWRFGRRAGRVTWGAITALACLPSILYGSYVQVFMLVDLSSKDMLGYFRSNAYMSIFYVYNAPLYEKNWALNQAAMMFFWFALAVDAFAHRASRADQPTLTPTHP